MSRASSLPALLPFLSVFIFVAGQITVAQDNGMSAGGNGRPTARIIEVNEAPELDGKVLDDPLWSGIPAETSFLQTTPDEGQPVSERTEVRLMYTSTTLYVGVVCYESDPTRIVVADSRRDADLDETDSFRMILDTYQDRQNGFVFGTNPTGVEYDAQVSNEGQGSEYAGGPRASASSGGGLNASWDGSWTVDVASGEYGWSAEFAIPFRTLRFEKGGPQDWGVNFQRVISRRQENAFWAPLPRQYELPRVSLAGTLTGLDIVPPRNLQITPYLLAQGVRDVVVDEYDAMDPGADVGVDLKYSITPALTLDATYNTDFAQVEVDEQQVNLDRFTLFFPEKRPFFLENAGVFSVGQASEIDLFFSRRIGIGPMGEAVPIVGGARLTGDLAGMKVGFLNMQTAQVGEAGIAGNNFGVARLKYELPNRTFVGGMVTNRQGVGDLSVGDDHNRLAAIDGQLGVGKYGVVTGFLARSSTPGEDENQYAFNVSTDYDSELWNIGGGFTEVSEGFNPEVGFVQRFGGYRKVHGLVLYRYRPDFLHFHELRPHVSYNGYFGLDGFYESGFLHIDNHWEWENGWQIHTGYNITREGVRADFVIADDIVVPEGEYNHSEWMLVGYTDPSLPLSLNNRVTFGGMFGGDRVTVTSTAKIRIGDAFNSEVAVSYNNVDLPGGSFVANLIRARLSYSFTPRVYTQALVQYNDSADIWSANVRFGWLQTAGTGFFVVFNQTSGFDNFLLPGVDNQTLVVKYSRLFNVLQ